MLIHKYDRVARSLEESARMDKLLKNKGVTLISITQDFGDNIMLKAIFWGMAEDYINNLAGETRKGLQENAIQAMHTGGYAPFG